MAKATPNQESAAHTNSAESTAKESPAVPYHILAVYLFVQPQLKQEDLPQLKATIETFCREHYVRGSLLLATEGINGTISYPPPAAGSEDQVLQFLKERFPTIRTRLSFSPGGHVFYRLKIKLKKEILTLRTEDPITTDPTQQKGIYVKPGEDWNKLLEDPDCWVIDARNDYEVRIGTFRNAQDPKTTNFSELVPWMKDGLKDRKPKKIAMFCTGGIRCEKASAACMDLAGNAIPVYHLEGGILAYLDEVPKEKSLWDGSCYVFDQRVAVGHGLEPINGVAMCYACRGPLRPEEQEGHPDFIQGEQCLYCKDKVSERQHERFQARQKQIQLAEKKGIVHIHDPKEQSFSKKQKAETAVP